MTLQDLQERAWEVAEDKGLHTDLDRLAPRDATLIRLVLIHSEVSEAVQEVKRHGVSPNNLHLLGEELADILIRVGDLATCLGIDLPLAVDHKMVKNRQRPYKFGTPEEVR